MNDQQRNLALILTIIFIGLVIFAIQSGKPATMKPKLLGNSSDNSNYPKAPELNGISGYINAPEGFKLSDQKGKIILVDFWTYSCINCMRTTPYLNAWYEKYAKDGLVIVGVHTPEFDFEKDYNNVNAAVIREGIKYPVVLDNNHGTWNAYQNRYWPRKYLIDQNGNIRYDHIGEGGYEETESMIQKLLIEAGASTDSKKVSSEIKSETDFLSIGSPELYLGYAFARAPLGNKEGFVPNAIIDYKLADKISPNLVYLEGRWKNNADNMELDSDSGVVVLHYLAKNVNIVASGTNELEIFIDDKPVGLAAGSDVDSYGKVKIDSERLYNIVSDREYSEHILKIKANKKFKLYTFTFG